jgi:cell division septum initiation protein DivIVA
MTTLEPATQTAPDTGALLTRLQALLDNARTMPLSSSVMINRDEFTDLLRDAVDGLPEELRQARWLLKERDGVLERAHRDAERVIEAAQVRAARMVERTEVVREARRTAERMIEDAERHAARIRHEAEDYVDRKLAALEALHERTLAQIHKGREQLQAKLEPAVVVDEDPAAPFFDQDEP